MEPQNNVGATDGAHTCPVPVTICPEPVFVVGAPRSGTTILAQALGRHPAFWAFDETQIFWDLFGNEHAHKHFRRRGPAGSWLVKQDIDRTRLLGSLGLGLNALLTGRSHGRRWIDQTPVHALLANDLAELFPGSRFLHMVRDGRRVVHSMMHYPHKIEPWAKDFRSACWTWSHYAEAALVFTAEHPDRCLTVINEQLVADPEKGYARILRFLEEPDNEAPAEYLRTHRVNSSFSSQSVAGDPGPSQSDPSSTWSSERQQAFWEEAGPTMVRCGYATEPDVEAVVGPVMHNWLGRVRHAAMRVAAPDTTVLVVNQGDSALLTVPRRTVWPFPGESKWAEDGSDFPDGPEAIAHLESLRPHGARHLLIPDRALEWLERRSRLQDHLKRNYRILWQDDTCLVYRLFQP